MGVVVRRYIDILTIIINFPYILHLCYIALFWQQHPYFFVHFLNVFFVLVYVIFVQYIANVTQKTFEIVQKNRDHANISIIKNVERASTACARESRSLENNKNKNKKQKWCFYFARRAP